MDYIVALLGRVLEDEQMLLYVFVAAAAGAAFLLGLGLMLLVSGLADPLRSRMGRWVGTGRARTGDRGERFSRRLQPMASYILPRNPKERDNARLRLVRAGYRAPNAVIVYYGIKTIAAVVMPAAVLMAVMLWRPGLAPLYTVMIAVWAAGLGVIGPNLFVERRTRRRQKALRNGLPDALDLLVVCTEAGLGLRAALQRVADELEVSHAELAEELALVNAEVRAGMEHMEALRRLAERTGLDDISGLVSLLAQTIRFGTSVAEALRTYAEEFRDRRMQRAEEQAAKIGTKLIFPLVLCLFPSFFVVAIGPGILGVIRAFQHL